MFAEERFIGFMHALGLRRTRPGGNHSRVHESDVQHAHEIYQVSTLNALMEGAYDGALTIGQLRTHGNLGLGTFDALDIAARWLRI
ncbi:MAG: acetolactate decarboxylase [Caldilineaceae bacterium]